MHRRTRARGTQGDLNERMATFGPGALTDAELVAMVLSGTRTADPSLAHHVLSTIGSPHSLLSRRAGELAAIPGMTPARADRLLAAVELGRRAALPRADQDILSNSADVARHCARLSTETNEMFLAISMNARNRVIGEWVVSRGWESGVNLTPRMVFTLLVKEGASRAIFVHNHPSGDPAPSAEDIRFTKRLLEAARTLGIKVLDHVIVASQGATSIREQCRDLDFG